MGYEQGHAAVPGNPIQFLKPNIRIPLAKHEEQRRILRQRIWKLNITGSLRTWEVSSLISRLIHRLSVICLQTSLRPSRLRNPEGENRADTVRLRFKRVRVEGRRIVIHIEFVKPF